MATDNRGWEPVFCFPIATKSSTIADSGDTFARKSMPVLYP